MWIYSTVTNHQITMPYSSLCRSHRICSVAEWVLREVEEVYLDNIQSLPWVQISATSTEPTSIWEQLRRSQGRPTACPPAPPLPQEDRSKKISTEVKKSLMTSRESWNSNIVCYPTGQRNHADNSLSWAVYPGRYTAIGGMPQSSFCHWRWCHSSYQLPLQ